MTDYRVQYLKAEQRIAELEWEVGQLLTQINLLRATIHGNIKREQTSTLDMMISAARGIPAGAK